MLPDWAKKRQAELEARAPKKRKKTDKVGPRVMVPLALFAMATTATKTPKAMFYAWLLYQTWHTGSDTVTVPNGALAKYGISREIKRRALKQLESAGLITVERPSRKTVIVTLHRTIKNKS